MTIFTNILHYDQKSDRTVGRGRPTVLRKWTDKKKIRHNYF
jgi:hypothetical protein